MALRVLASVAWWPAITTLADSWPYAAYAAHDVLANPQHPAGYSLLLALQGLVTHELAVTIILQHVGGVLTGLRDLLVAAAPERPDLAECSANGAPRASP